MDKIEVYREVCERIADSGRYEAELRLEYSGRGMYGQSTPAIVTDASPVTIGKFIAIVVLEQLIEENDEYDLYDLQIDFADLLEGMQLGRSDSMGLSTVYY